MKCSLGISNFLEEISRFYLSIVFDYFFALITKEGFVIFPCYSFELCIQMLISFFFSFAFTSLLFTAIYKASSDSHFAFLHFFFLGMVLIIRDISSFGMRGHTSLDILTGYLYSLKSTYCFHNSIYRK